MLSSQHKVNKLLDVCHFFVAVAVAPTFAALLDARAAAGGEAKICDSLRIQGIKAGGGPGRRANSLCNIRNQGGRPGEPDSSHSISSVDTRAALAIDRIAALSPFDADYTIYRYGASTGPVPCLEGGGVSEHLLSVIVRRVSRFPGT